MCQEAIELANYLKKYTHELIDAKSENHKKAIKGRTQMILTVLDKLRNLHKVNPLPADLISQITKDKERAALDLPDSYADYQSICWHCYRTSKKKVIVDKRVDPVCAKCGWVKCPVCGACLDPKFGICPDNILFQSDEIPF